MKQLETFLALPFPLTIAVLPGLPNSEKAASAVRAAGKELILHQPMQAIGGQNPGPGAIRLGMGAHEVERIVEANLLTVPGAVGMNNHMGSAVTADLGIMESVEEVAKSRGIYYLDSLTTSGTAVARGRVREREFDIGSAMCSSITRPIGHRLSGPSRTARSAPRRTGRPS